MNDAILSGQGRDVHDEADVVVVGSGAGGAVVAAELAEAGQRVIVLEEGANIPAGRYGAMRPSESMRYLWRDGGLTFAVGLGRTPMINVMTGRCIGGSSVLTGGVCFRIPERVLYEWGAFRGLKGFDSASMEPCFEAVERAVNVETVPELLRSKSTSVFVRGAERLGYAMKPLRRNTRGCNGCGRCNFGCPHGAKLSVDVTYLPRALAAGARIYSHCLVDVVTHQGGRATGVRGRTLSDANGKPGGRLTIRARRVVLAAGALGTPLILMRTGFARATREVGKNLTLHPGFRVMARFEEKIEGWKGALQSVYSDAFEALGITLVGMFVPPGVLAATLPGIGSSHVARARQIPHISVFGGMIHDDPGGRVRSWLGRTVITYRFSDRDREVVPILLRKMAEIYFSAGAKEVFLPILGLGGIDRDHFRQLDLEQVSPRLLECTSQHPLGTCRMGNTPAHSVVDSYGGAWALEELFIADGSIVPTSLGVNPQLGIMALATRVAWMLRDRPLPSSRR